MSSNRFNNQNMINIMGAVTIAAFLLFDKYYVNKKSVPTPEEVANSYLESLVSNHEMNEEIDQLIVEFMDDFKSEDYLAYLKMGDRFESYLGVELDSDKKARLNILGTMAGSQKTEKNLEHFLYNANQTMRSNINEDNDLKSYYSLSFYSGDQESWIVSKESYKIYDDLLAQYAISYELLSDRFTDLTANVEEFDHILAGVLKSSLCEIELDRDIYEHQAKINIPDDVKKLVKERKSQKEKK